MSTSRRAAFYYILSISLMTLYGGQVCPFVNSLPVWDWLVVMAVGYGLAFGSRVVLEPRVVLGVNLWARGRRQFWLEMGVTTLLGIGITAYDTIVFSFPVESGLKMLLGVWCFGFFMALDMTLARERAMALRAKAKQTRLDTGLPFHSLTRKILVLATIWTAFNTAIIAMVVFKDIAHLGDFMENMLQAEALSAALEIIFVGLVLLGFTIRIVYSYSRNLRLYFEMQAEVLEAVGTGELSRYVPVISTDEFGRIATHTNTMIEGLRDKERIQSVFGKMVDPRVAQRLVDESREGLSLGGERRTLAVMIVDIRDFTPRTERYEPEEVVEDLNLFLAAAVRIITTHGGMIDKFLGDGILAVFGLGREGEDMEDGKSGMSDEPPADCALAAALELVEATAKLAPVLREPMKIGVGLHMGSVISGLIGSPERLEFTVIGDVVNTAARLESLTKEIDSPIAVSSELRGNLETDELKKALISMGAHALKGKSEEVEVWGVKASE